MLREDHQLQRIDFSADADEKDNFLDSIVTGDETRAFHFTPEKNRHVRFDASTKTWRRTGLTRAYKNKLSQSSQKCIQKWRLSV